MFPATRLKQYLEQEKVRYQHTFHRTTLTSQEVASEAHVSGKMIAKAVVIKVNSSFALAVLPASEQVDVPALKAALEAKELRLATEFEFTGLITDCDVGAMLPFGNLYGLLVYVERLLTLDEEIVFNAGTHQDSICLKYVDFARLVRPRVIGFGLEHAAKAGGVLLPRSLDFRAQASSFSS